MKIKSGSRRHIFHCFVRNLPLMAGYSALIFNQTLVKDKTAEQGWHSAENTRLPPTWSEFNSQIHDHIWADFVGSLLCSEFLRVLRFSPLLKNQYDLICINLI